MKNTKTSRPLAGVLAVLLSVLMLASTAFTCFADTTAAAGGESVAEEENAEVKAPLLAGASSFYSYSTTLTNGGSDSTGATASLSGFKLYDTTKGTALTVKKSGNVDDYSEDTSAEYGDRLKLSLTVALSTASGQTFKSGDTYYLPLSIANTSANDIADTAVYTPDGVLIGYWHTSGMNIYIEFNENVEGMSDVTVSLESPANWLNVGGNSYIDAITNYIKFNSEFEYRYRRNARKVSYIYYDQKGAGKTSNSLQNWEFRIGTPTTRRLFDTQGEIASKYYNYV